MADRVLVTGISGFIGSHIAVKLLEKGYVVRGTVRRFARLQPKMKPRLNWLKQSSLLMPVGTRLFRIVNLFST